MKDYRNFLLTTENPGPHSGLTEISGGLWASYAPAVLGEHFCFLHGIIHNLSELAEPESEVTLSTLTGLYLRDPAAFPSLLKGSFCIVIGNAEKLHIYRDGNGYENIYFSDGKAGKDGITVSNSVSEILKLRQLEVNTEVLPAYFLKADLNSGECFFKGFESLAFFEFAEISRKDGSLKKAFFDNFFIGGKTKKRVNITKVVDEFESLTESIISEKLSQFSPGTVIVNALSGGTDSSYIQYFLKEKNELLACTANYSNAGMDKEYAGDVAALLSLKHRVFESDTSRMIANMPEGILLCEKPFMFSGETLLMEMYRGIGNELKKPAACFDGAGAEGIMGASRVLYELRIIRKFRILVPLLLPLLRLKSKKMYLRYSEFYRLVNKKDIPGDFILKYFTDANIHSAVKDAFGLENLSAATAFETEMMKTYGTTLFEAFYRFLAFEHEFRRTVNVRTQLAKPHSISLVLPFTETSLYRFLLQFDTEIKLRNAKTKYIFRKAMERKFPKNIIYRRKIRKNVSVTDEILKDPRGAELVKEITERKYPYFSFDYAKVFSDRRYSTLAYKLINFHIWHRIFIDRDPEMLKAAQP